MKIHRNILPVTPGFIEPYVYNTLPNNFVIRHSIDRKSDIINQLAIIVHDINDS